MYEERQWNNAWEDDYDYDEEYDVSHNYDIGDDDENAEAV